jgi:hypothetical protein
MSSWKCVQSYEIPYRIFGTSYLYHLKLSILLTLEDWNIVPERQQGVATTPYVITQNSTVLISNINRNT